MITRCLIFQKQIHIVVLPTESFVLGSLNSERENYNNSEKFVEKLPNYLETYRQSREGCDSISRRTKFISWKLIIILFLMFLDFPAYFL